MEQREIKFRGNKIQTKEWIYGNLIYHPKDKLACISQIRNNPVSNGIIQGWCFGVYSDSVGQFTSLKDKNGIEIYEGDIICNFEYTKSLDFRGIVKFSHGVFGAEWLVNIESKSMVGSWGQNHNLRRLDDDIIERQIVIGNIYENPELIKL